MRLEPVDLFVPGRLCLFGEHSDWAGALRVSDPSIPPGRCLIAGTDQGVLATASPLEGYFELGQPGPDGSPAPLFRSPADPDLLRSVAVSAGFESYAAGVACLVLERHPGAGVRIDVRERTLPLAKGLSSSAAICVLTARAFSRACSLGFTVEEEMDLAYRGELLTGSSCGRMDQACAYGSVTVELTFDGDSMGVGSVSPGCDMHMLIADLGASKDTRRILSDLGAAFSAGDPGIRRALGACNQDILSRAIHHLESGDAEALGALMTEAQEVFDRFVAPCSAALASPALHCVLAHPASLALAWGGKGVGSQGDGSAQFLCRGPEEREELSRRLSLLPGVSCLSLTLRSGRFLVSDASDASPSC